MTIKSKLYIKITQEKIEHFQTKGIEFPKLSIEISLKKLLQKIQGKIELLQHQTNNIKDSISSINESIIEWFKKTQEKISQDLEEMYGASFNCGLDKTGDNHILKFYLESVNDNFLPQTDENMLKTSCDKLFEIVFNPLTENEAFKQEYIKQEFGLIAHSSYIAEIKRKYGLEYLNIIKEPC